MADAPRRPAVAALPVLAGLVALLLVVAVAAVVLVRSPDEPSPDVAVPPVAAPPTPVDAPSLGAVWEVGASATTRPVVLPELSAPDTTVLADGDDLWAVADASGETRWRASAGTPCDLAARGPGGDLAVVVTASSRRPCGALALVDGDDGTVRWTRRVPELDVVSQQLAVGSTSVTWLHDAEGQRRFALDDGADLPDLDLGEASAALSSTVAVVATGSPVTDGMRVLDVDTGETIAEPDVRGATAGVVIEAVVSTDPLVVDAQVQGHRAAWPVDLAAGTLDDPLGPQVDEPVGEDRLTALTTYDDVVVVRRTGQAPLTYAADATTGDPLWELPADAPLTVLGSDDAGLVGLAPQPGPAPEQAAAPVLVVRTDPRDLADAAVLGTIDGGPGAVPTVHLGDGVLVVPGDGVLRGYRVPGPDEAVPDAVLPPLDVAYETGPSESAATEAETYAYRAEDVPAAEVALCALSPETLRAVGWGDWADLPRSADCRWTHRERRWQMTVDAQVTAVRPYVAGTDPPQGRVPHHEAAALLAADRPAYAADVPGLADGAWLARPAVVGAEGDRVVVRARLANLIVTVDLELAESPYDLAGGAERPSRRDLDSAALLALADLLAPYDGTVPQTLPRGGAERG
ncbi:MAG: hypothetical protein CMH83_14990 [Nocardioides sp.]|nr:hypothetical protein [Nocardioides sp.]